MLVNFFSVLPLVIVVKREMVSYEIGTKILGLGLGLGLEGMNRGRAFFSFFFLLLMDHWC